MTSRSQNGDDRAKVITTHSVVEPLAPVGAGSTEEAEWTSEDYEAARSANAMLRAVRRIIRRVSLHSHTLSRTVGLTLPQILVLRALHAAEEPLSNREVAARVQLSAPTVSGILDRLDRMGLLHRERSTLDRRRMLVTLSPAGKERVEAMPLSLQEQFTRRLRELPADEREQLLGGLEQLVELLEAQAIDAAPILATEDDLRRD